MRKLLLILSLCASSSFGATKPGSAVWQSGNSLASGCLRYWFIDSSTSAITDYSPSAQNITMSNAATLTTAPGGTGNAYLLAGTNQVGTASDSGLPTGTSAWTIAAWAKTTQSFGTAKDAFIVGWGAILSGNNRVYLEQNYDGSINGYFVQNNAGLNTVSTNQWNDGNWHRVVATFDGTDVRFYVDGTLNGTKPFIANTTLSSVMAFGATGTTAASWNGSIGDLAIWNRTLSAGDVTSDFTDPWQEVRAAGSSSFTITPTTVQNNHSGNITLTLAGTSTSWNNGTTIFTPSGVSGVTKISQNVSSTTAATVVITTGSGTGTLTLTESVTGTAASSLTVQPTVPLNDATIYKSPYAWRLSSTAEICPVGGCYLKFNFTTGPSCGTACTLIVNGDTTLNSAATNNDMPSIKTFVSTATQAGNWVISQFTSDNNADSPLTIYNNLNASTTYRVEMYMYGGNPVTSNGWSGTFFQTKLNSIQFDVGGSTSAITPRTKTCIFWGDSYESGYFGQTGVGPVYNWLDPSQTWAFGVAQAQVLNCEYLLVGIGSQGYQNVGNGSYPAFTSSWDHYDSTHAKTFSPSPDYVIVRHGANDAAFSGASEITAVGAWLTSARSALGGAAQIFLVGGIHNTGGYATINAALNTAVTGSGDTKAHFISSATEYSTSIFSSCTASFMSPDCIHLTSMYQNAIIGNIVTGGVTKVLFGGTGGAGSFPIGQ